MRVLHSLATTLVKRNGSATKLVPCNRKANETNDVLRVSVLFYRCSDRDTLDRSLRSKENMWKSLCLRRGPSCLARGHPLPRWVINPFERGELSKVQDVDALVSYWILQLLVLNNVPRVPNVRLHLLRRHCVGPLKSTCDLVPTFHGFVRASCFLACTCGTLRLFPLYLYNLRIYVFVLFEIDASRHGGLRLLD